MLLFLKYLLMVCTVIIGRQWSFQFPVVIAMIDSSFPHDQSENMLSVERDILVSKKRNMF